MVSQFRTGHTARPWHLTLDNAAQIGTRRPGGIVRSCLCVLTAEDPSESCTYKRPNPLGRRTPTEQ